MATQSRRLKKLYLIGDSNIQKGFQSEGFVALLANEYIRKCDVVNRGFSGYTSKHLKCILRSMLTEDNKDSSIEVAVLMIGSNDANLFEEDQHRHTPLDKYKENVEDLLISLKEHNIGLIVLLSPPPIDNKAWNASCRSAKNISTKLSKEHVLPYADVTKKLAAKHDVQHVDLYHDMLANEDWRGYLSDGLHLSPRGSMFVFSKLKGHLDKIYNEMKTLYPDWKELNDSNYTEKLQ